MVYRPEQRILFNGNLGHIVGLLTTLANSNYRDAKIFIYKESNESFFASFKIDELDLAFMMRWAQALSRERRPITHDAATVHIPLGLKPADEPARSFGAVLASTFAKEQFKCTGGIDFTWGDLHFTLAAGEVKTGEQWNKVIEAQLELLRTARHKKELHDAEVAGQETFSKTGGKKKSQRKTKPSDSDVEGDFTIELHPVFVKDASRARELVGEPDQYVVLPARGTARAFEWWHYQDKEANGKPWIDLMEEIGYAKNALGKKTCAEYYHRPGMGYAESNWNGKGHGASPAPVENSPGELDNKPLLEPPATKAAAPKTGRRGH